MLTKRDTNPFVWILVFAFLKSIFTHSLKQSLKPHFSKHKSIHPHSALSNAFCWSRNIIPPLHLPFLYSLWYAVIIYSPEKYSYPLRTPFGRY
jgi:hypothetical protein